MNVYVPALMRNRKDWKYHTKFSCVQSLGFEYRYLPIEEANALGFNCHCLKCQTTKSVKGKK